jgi:hypothetical protein
MNEPAKIVQSDTKRFLTHIFTWSKLFQENAKLSATTVLDKDANSSVGYKAAETNPKTLTYSNWNEVRATLDSVT